MMDGNDYQKTKRAKSGQHSEKVGDTDDFLYVITPGYDWVGWCKKATLSPKIFFLPYKSKTFHLRKYYACSYFHIFK